MRGGGTVFRHYFGEASHVLACPVAKTQWVLAARHMRRDVTVTHVRRVVRPLLERGALVLTPQWLVASCRAGRVGRGVGVHA